jgi:hypothetical protein
MKKKTFLHPIFYCSHFFVAAIDAESDFGHHGCGMNAETTQPVYVRIDWTLARNS